MTTIPFYQVGTLAAGNRLLDPELRSVQSDPGRSNALTKGHRACQGCGEALGARWALDAALRATGGRLIAANATGCLEVFSTPYPESSWQLPWIHSLFANAPSVATGIAAALKVKGRDDVRVIGQGGDGGTVDIGFASLSGMFERGDDVLFICYDNEAYMNTGVQRSGATPPAARTATTQVVGVEPGNVFGQGKNVPQIAIAHEIPYVATATVADLRDLEAKVTRAMEIRGARYLHVYVTCPLGFGCAAGDTIKVARLAVQTGLYPVIEAELGEVVRVQKIRHPMPVEAYLRLQRRFVHLFEPERRDDVIRRIQAIADRNIERYGLGVMDKPFAITLDVGSSLANKTGSWREQRPVYVDRLPPCNDACPAGENIQQWLYHAQGGDYERAWRQLVRDNPLPAVMGRVCYHPCETACNRAELDQAVGIHGVERFLGDEAIAHGWELDPPKTESGKRVLVVGAGPSGLSAAYQLRCAGHAVTIRDAEQRAGGMMRYGIPKYRLPRAVLDAEIDRIAALGIELELGHRVTDIVSEMEPFDAAFLAVGAHIGRRAYIPAGEAARILDAVALLHGVEEGERIRLGRHVAVYGGGNTAFDAARTARRLGATDAVVVYRRNRDRMPAHDSELQQALDEGIAVKWLSTIHHADGGKLTLERMELDASGFPQPTGEFEELDADSLVLALGQDADLSLLDGIPGIESEDGVVTVDQRMMTGYEGIFAGGDMVPAERTVTVAVGHGKRAARHIDAWLRGEVWSPPPRNQRADFDTLHPWYFTDAPESVAPQLELARRQSTFDEVDLGLGGSTALYEARRCLSCGNCFECDNCYGVCPDNAIVKLGAGERYEIDLDYCKGCGICMEECPCGAIALEPEPV